MKKLVGAVVTVVCGGVAHGAVVDQVYFKAPPLVVVWGTNAAGDPAVVSDFVLLNTASGTAGADLMAGNVVPVLTGSMTPIPAVPSGNSLVSISGPAAVPAGGGVVTDAGSIGQLDAADSVTSFGLGPSTQLAFSSAPHRHSFYVASNAAFDVYAQAGAAAYTGTFSAASVPLNSMSWQLTLATSGNDGGVAWGGPAAQDPTGGGAGIASGAAADDLGDFAASTKVFGGGQKTAAAPGSLLQQSVRFTAQYGMAYDMSMGSGSVSVPVTYTVYTP